MNLYEALTTLVNDVTKTQQPADLRVGTVTGISPLTININTAMADLQQESLLLTSAVVERKIPVLDHSHDINTLAHSHTNAAGGTTTDLSDTYSTLKALVQPAIFCTEHGTPLPVEDGHIILNRALAVGDKVLLLRVMQGARYIVLSRVFLP